MLLQELSHSSLPECRLALYFFERNHLIYWKELYKDALPDLYEQFVVDLVDERVELSMRLVQIVYFIKKLLETVLQIQDFQFGRPRCLDFERVAIFFGQQNKWKNQPQIFKGNDCIDNDRSKSDCLIV